MEQQHQWSQKCGCQQTQHSAWCPWADGLAGSSGSEPDISVDVTPDGSDGGVQRTYKYPCQGGVWKKQCEEYPIFPKVRHHMEYSRKNLEANIAFG